MGLSGLLLVAFGSSVHGVLTWVWPPAVLALVIWMLVRARQQLRSPSRRWLLYPVLAVLALASVGGGYQTVREAVDAGAYPMPGQLIDVGGHGLHLSCTGSCSPQSSSNQVRAGCPRTSGSQPKPSLVTRGSASTTVRAAGGASPLTLPRTPHRL